MKRAFDFMIINRKVIETMLVAMLMIFASCGGFIFINRILSIPNDHLAEQKLEEVLCEELDICLDLTPTDD